MVDEPFRALDELVGVRQVGVHLEGGFIDPARVDEEQPRIPNRGIDPHLQAARLGAHALDLLPQRRFQRLFLAFARVETGRK
jgi:hypothetical protein